MSRLSLIATTVAMFARAANFEAAENRPTRTPVLLELFTSEGCSSCPPADRLLESLDQKQPIAGADLIVLSEHVDYWDRLGWRDPYSSPQHSARQQDYTNKYHLDGVYTPQLVVDGRFGLVGSDLREATGAIQKAVRQQKIPITVSHASRNGNEVAANISLPVSDPAARGVSGILYVALADNRAESHVARGENSGRLLAHVAVTRVLKPLGKVELSNGLTKDVWIMVPPGAGSNGLRIVVFLQDPQSGHILGVTEQKL